MRIYTQLCEQGCPDSKEVIVTAISVRSAIASMPLALLMMGALASCDTAEGVYGGTQTGGTSTDFVTLILEDGSYWSVYGQNLGSAFQVAGVVQGSGKSKEGAFTSSNIKDFRVSPALAGELTATYKHSSNKLDGTHTFTGSTVHFTGDTIPGSSYSYDKAPVLADIAGNWPLGGFLLSVSSTGAAQLTGTGTAACTGSGTFVPRPSGKNVYNVSLTFSITTGCPARAGLSYTGVALMYPITATSQRQLLIATVDGGRNTGSVFAAVR
jgi:hypothetical protein